MRVRTLRVSLEEQFVYLGLENGDVYVVAVKMYLCCPLYTSDAADEL